jgi:hypothetical protein
MAETHKHRNIIDDILDLGLLVVGLLYFLFGHRIGLELTDKELAAIASSGATARILVRKILMRIWGEEVASLEAASSPLPEPAPSETPTEAPVSESEDEPTDEALVPPPPNVGGH